MSQKIKLVISCEHATSHIPSAWRYLFRKNIAITGPWGHLKTKEFLHDHWGYDIGALKTARYLSKKFKVRLHSTSVSRLLVEANRYRTKNIFSPFTSPLSEKKRRVLYETYWKPHVERLKKIIEEKLSGQGTVLHVGVHSFTPIYKKKVRKGDLGILFDPRRREEAHLAHAWQKELKKLLPSLNIRKNFPYSGKSEGLTTLFRKKFGKKYLGIELEINNKHLSEKNHSSQIKPMVMLSLKNALAHLHTK